MRSSDARRPAVEYQGLSLVISASEDLRGDDEILSIPGTLFDAESHGFTHDSLRISVSVGLRVVEEIDPSFVSALHDRRGRLCNLDTRKLPL